MTSTGRQNRRGNPDKDRLFFDPTSISEEEVEQLSRPRKMTPASNKRRAKKSAILQYSEIPSIPEIKLTIEDMKKDPIELLVRLESRYSEFGAVKLSVPCEWKSPFCFNFGEISIKTRIQQLHKLKQGKSFKENEEAYNVRNFQAMATDFEKQYKFKTNSSGRTPNQKIQSEYWNLVNAKYEGPEWKFKTTVEYAADLPVTKHGSGFPLFETARSKDEHFDYHSNLFNLNNIYKSPLSLLQITDEKKEYISGITMPWVYMGMIFSSFCWHVEDLWLNSLNFSHKGATKTWYVVPSKDKEKLDEYVRRKTGRQDLLDKITFMIDPLQLINNGISVFKTHQQPGDYVCTFFKAYHAGFSQGFNVGQAVNFASPLSLSYIRQSTASREEENMKPSVLSYEWLVYQNYMSGKWKHNKEMESIIRKEYERLLKQQYEGVKKICEKYNVRKGAQINQLAKYDKNSCSKCRNYQYLSSFRCLGCEKNYCFKDLQKCCFGNYELIVRELNADRRKLKELINKYSKLFNFIIFLQSLEVKNVMLWLFYSLLISNHTFQRQKDIWESIGSQEI